MTDKTKENGKAPDTLDSLALSIIPLSSSTLKNARLIKNARMETTVELYNDPVAGSLQIYPDDIADQISASGRDQEIISQLAGLNSYDVYSLRAGLKKLGLDVTDPAALELSEEMKDSLGEIAVQFTRPLVEKIFGSGQADGSDPKALMKIFRDPDVNRVRENLRTMTDKTGIPMEDIPKFLEEYSDVFFSVAYYRHSFEIISPEADRFLEWVKDLRVHRDVAGSPQTAQSCRKVDDSMRFLIASIKERLMRFQASFDMFWGNINKDTFETLRGQIEENHSSMGAILCGLNVKLRNWSKEFPESTIGGPQKRAKYVMTDLEPGIEKLRTMEFDARKKMGMGGK